MERMSWIVCVAKGGVCEESLEPEDEYDTLCHCTEAAALESATFWRDRGYRVRVWRATWSEVS